jgi:hypothetical protein
MIQSSMHLDGMRAAWICGDCAPIRRKERNFVDSVENAGKEGSGVPIRYPTGSVGFGRGRQAFCLSFPKVRDQHHYRIVSAYMGLWRPICGGFGLGTRPFQGLEISQFCKEQAGTLRRIWVRESSFFACSPELG